MFKRICCLTTWLPVVIAAFMAAGRVAWGRETQYQVTYEGVLLRPETGASAEQRLPFRLKRVRFGKHTGSMWTVLDKNGRPATQEALKQLGGIEPVALFRSGRKAWSSTASLEVVGESTQRIELAIWREGRQRLSGKSFDVYQGIGSVWLDATSSVSLQRRWWVDYEWVPYRVETRVLVRDRNRSSLSVVIEQAISSNSKEK